MLITCHCKESTNSPISELSSDARLVWAVKCSGPGFSIYCNCAVWNIIYRLLFNLPHIYGLVKKIIQVGAIHYLLHNKD